MHLPVLTCGRGLREVTDSCFSWIGRFPKTSLIHNLAGRTDVKTGSLAAYAQPSLLLADHAIHGLFHLDLDSGRIDVVEKPLHTRAEQARAMRTGDLPARIHLLNPQAQLQQSLWEAPSGKGMALDDFYPYARQILGAKAEETTVCVSLTLSSEGKQALTQVKGGKPRHWRLRLGKAAQERCGRDVIDPELCSRPCKTPAPRMNAHFFEVFCVPNPLRNVMVEAIF